MHGVQAPGCHGADPEANGRSAPGYDSGLSSWDSGVIRLRIRRDAGTEWAGDSTGDHVEVGPICLQIAIRRVIIVVLGQWTCGDVIELDGISDLSCLIGRGNEMYSGIVCVAKDGSGTEIIT
jgi:hypothetical protein